jgi:hypothetical protein
MVDTGACTQAFRMDVVTDVSIGHSNAQGVKNPRSEEGPAGLEGYGNINRRAGGTDGAGLLLESRRMKLKFCFAAIVRCPDWTKLTPEILPSVRRR